MVQTSQHCVFESEMISKTKADVMDVISLPELRDLHEAGGRFERTQCCVLTSDNLKEISQIHSLRVKLTV